MSGLEALGEGSLLAAVFVALACIPAVALSALRQSTSRRAFWITVSLIAVLLAGVVATRAAKGAGDDALFIALFSGTTVLLPTLAGATAVDRLPAGQALRVRHIPSVAAVVALAAWLPFGVASMLFGEDTWERLLAGIALLLMAYFLSRARQGFALSINCYDDRPAEYKYETAFAYGASAATCFSSFDFDSDGRRDFSRWGWSNGPIAAGTYTYDIYAAAGQCNLSNGTRVGSLTVSYNGSTATVTFAMLPGYVMDETHLYVGGEPLARDVNNEYTVAPGQYPVQHDLTRATTDSYTVTGLSGSIYVVAHAVVGIPQ